MMGISIIPANGLFVLFFSRLIKSPYKMYKKSFSNTTFNYLINFLFTKTIRSTIKPIIKQNEIDDIISKVRKSSINKFQKTTGERSGDIVSM